MKRMPSSSLRTGLLVLLFLTVNAGGIMLARAANQDVDQLLHQLDPKAVERPAEALLSNRSLLNGLFKVNASATARETGAFDPADQEVDVQRVTEVMAGQLGSFDFTSGSPAELASKTQDLRERMEVQSEIARRVSISAFEQAVLDRQVGALTEKKQAGSALEQSVNKKFIDVLKASSKAGSFMNKPVTL